MKHRHTNPNGIPARDIRGRGPSANKISGPRQQHVHDHIQSLPDTTSHYSTTHSPHPHFLFVDMRVKNLHELYVEWLKKNFQEKNQSLNHITVMCTQISTT